MEKDKSPLILLLSLCALAGNIFFILWVSYNAIHEEFSGTLPEKVSYIALMGLLILNTFLILGRQKQ